MNPSTTAPATPLGPVVKGLMIVGLFLVFLVVGLVGLAAYRFIRLQNKPHSPTPAHELYAATAKIGPSGPVASGNSEEASELAAKMAGKMETIRVSRFTQLAEKSLIDRKDTFKVYCDLSSEHCVFLVHVPELRRFQTEAKKTLGNISWQAAQEVLRASTLTNTPGSLAVAFRGTIAYDRVLLGNYSADSSEEKQSIPEIQEGFGCEKRLIPWFTSPETLPQPDSRKEQTEKL